MKKPRHLSNDERALWDQVAQNMVPMKPEIRKNAPLVAPAAKREKPPISIDRFDMGGAAAPSTSFDPMPTVGAQLRNAPLQMDNKSFGKMTRGKLKPEGRIDLHGMTMSEAHPELTNFVLGAHAMGKRLVLVITGKGRINDDHGPIPERRGILRHQVPQWLSLPPLSSAVLQVTPAHIRHGGDGAYYVYLRRRR